MAPHIDFDEGGIVDVETNQFMANVLPFPVPAVNEGWVQVAVVPWEGENEVFSWSPIEKLCNFWFATCEDLTFACFPPEAAFTTITWLIIVRVLHSDIICKDSVPVVVSGSPEIYSILSATGWIITWANRCCTDVASLVQAISWVARETTLTVPCFNILDKATMNIRC